MNWVALFPCFVLQNEEEYFQVDFLWEGKEKLVLIRDEFVYFLAKVKYDYENLFL